ncbi:MAG: diguanylate cyclase [Alphaproteobacteria bacterium]|nr:diguanylate cyclase [Alphaproteobacteria bacterium]
MADEGQKEQGRSILAAFAEDTPLPEADLREALLAAHRQIGLLENQNADLIQQLEQQEALLTVKDEVIAELEKEIDDSDIALAHSAVETMEATKQWKAAEEEVDKTKRQNAELKKLALTDPLTKLWTRNGGEIHYAKLVNMAIRRTRELARAHEKNPEIDPRGPKKAFICPIFIDVDHFKAVNDTHGHKVGDQVLVSVAQTLSESIRSNDVLMRPGGEEMVCYAIVEAHSLSEAKHVAVSKIAERMRTSVQEKGYVVDGKKHELTISLGVDAFPPSFVTKFSPPFLPPEKFHIPTVEELNNRPAGEVYACMEATEQADFLAYQAKENNRNAVVYENDGGRIVIYGREHDVLIFKTKEQKAEEERAKLEAAKAADGESPKEAPSIERMRPNRLGLRRGAKPVL